MRGMGRLIGYHQKAWQKAPQKKRQQSAGVRLLLLSLLLVFAILPPLQAKAVVCTPLTCVLGLPVLAGFMLRHGGALLENEQNMPKEPVSQLFAWKLKIKARLDAFTAKMRSRHAQANGVLDVETVINHLPDGLQGQCSLGKAASALAAGGPFNGQNSSGAPFRNTGGPAEAVARELACLATNTKCGSASGGGGGILDAMFLFPEGTYDATFDALRSEFLPPYFSPDSPGMGAANNNQGEPWVAAIPEREGLSGLYVKNGLEPSLIAVMDPQISALNYFENLGKSAIGTPQKINGTDEENIQSRREIFRFGLNIRMAVGPLAVPELLTGLDGGSLSEPTKVGAVMQTAVRAAYGVAPVAKSAAEVMSLGFLLRNTVPDRAQRNEVMQKLGSLKDVLNTRCDSMLCLIEHLAVGRSMRQSFQTVQGRVNYFEYLGTLGDAGLKSEYLAQEVVSNYLLKLILDRKRLRTEIRGVALIDSQEERMVKEGFTEPLDTPFALQ